MAVQAGFRTRHFTTVAITAVCRNVTLTADMHAKEYITKEGKVQTFIIEISDALLNLYK